MPEIAQQDAATSAEKLVSATLSAFANLGVADVSARSLAAAAGLPTSSIHYHFGGLGRLFETAQQAAVAAAAQWCATIRAAIGSDAKSPPMLASLLAGMIDDWCETQRPLAFVQREAQLMALRDAASAPLAAAWEALWCDHFAQVLTPMGISDLAMMTGWFFDGASSLHLLRWRRPLDRGALDELCQGWANWVNGRFGTEGHWYSLGRSDAERLIPADAQAAAIDSVAIAAAATLADGGVTALTHRAVAARAGLTLGMVSYRYRTSAELLQAAFLAIHHKMVSGGPVPGPVEGQLATGTTDPGLPARGDLLSSEELVVAAARREDLQPFAARLRYLRGRSSGRFLRAIVPQDRALSTIDYAVFSALVGARARSYAAAGRPADDGCRRDDLSPILARLGVS